MSRTLKLALSAVLATTLVSPALAQDNFPDVPDHHWAYEALSNMMQEGILVGYPDGLFRGGRPASRYELAMAINAAYQKLAGMTGGISERIDELERAIDARPAQPPGVGDTQALRTELEALRTQVNNMRGWGDDIANLRRLATTFERELASLGVDVEAMKRDLADIDARVRRLEGVRPAVAISGDVNLLVLGGISVDETFGLTPSGWLTGIGEKGHSGAPVGLTRDLSILHEAALTFAGTNEEGPKWSATLSIGNILPAVGNLNTLGNWDGFSDDVDAEVAFERFGVSFDTSLVGQNFSAEIGRLGVKVGPYLMQRPDYTDFYHNPRWDNGEFVLDGAKVAFGFGDAKLQVVGGRTSDRQGVDMNDLSPVPFNGATIDTTLGVILAFPLMQNGGLNLAYLWHDSDTTVSGANRVNVYGGELYLNFGQLNLTANYSASTLSYNTDNLVDDDNTAWDVKAAYKTDSWGIGAGYREIESNFAAAGDWGRVGTSWNPVNVKGFNAKAWIRPASGLKLYGTFEQLEPKEEALDVLVPGLGTTNTLDKVSSWTVGLEYQLNPAWMLGFSYEDVKWQHVTGSGLDDAKERWYNIKLGHNLGPNAKLYLGYMISDIAYPTLPMGIAQYGGDRFKGGLFTTQLSIRF